MAPGRLTPPRETVSPLSWARLVRGPDPTSSAGSGVPISITGPPVGRRVVRVVGDQQGRQRIGPGVFEDEVNACASRSATIELGKRLVEQERARLGEQGAH